MCIHPPRCLPRQGCALTARDAPKAYLRGANALRSLSIRTYSVYTEPKKKKDKKKVSGLTETCAASLVILGVLREWGGIAGWSR